MEEWKHFISMQRYYYGEKILIKILEKKKKKRVCSIKTVRIRMGVLLERKRDPVDTLSWRNKGIVKHSVDRIEGI